MNTCEQLWKHYRDIQRGPNCEREKYLFAYEMVVALLFPDAPYEYVTGVRHFQAIHDDMLVEARPRNRYKPHET